MRRIFAFLALALALAFATPIAAHLTANSEVTVHFDEGRIRIEALMPAGDFAAAATPVVAENDAAALRWVVERVRAQSPDGEAWQIGEPTLRREMRDGSRLIVATMTFRPPAGHSARRLILDWQPIVATDRNHFALMLVGADPGGGVITYDRRLLGAVRAPTTRIAIDRGEYRQSAAFASAFRLGMHHIAEGADHLMFLLALLLPAPLLATGRRWGGPNPLRATVMALLRIVTAFTIGHSLTLIIAAAGSIRLPAAPVEFAIALSIFVSAIHAVRPIFAGREAWVAMLFGLVHGMAFATLVGDAGLGGAARVIPIIGFNLGIEVVQLVVVGAALLPMALVVAHPAYRIIRPLLAGIAGLAALGWMAERSIASEFSLVSDWADLATGHPLGIWLGAIMIAGVCRLLSHRSRGTRGE